MSDLHTPHADGGRLGRGGRRRSFAQIALGAAMAALAFAAFAGPVSAFEPEIAPVVLASPAVQVTGGFSLRGTIYTYSLDTHYHFEYGTTTAYGTNGPVPDADAGTAPMVPVSQTVTGLAPSTTYHFRLVATNSKGPGTGGDGTFTTPADPSAPPPPTPPPPTEKESGGSGSGKKVTVKEGKVKGRTVLTTSNGLTLYSLSAETKGKFVCTKKTGCLALWHPLMVPKGGTATGPVKLGKIKRPEGGLQVTYRGLPLYSFVPDKKPGQAKGEGVKDVGTWHAASVSK